MTHKNTEERTVIQAATDAELQEYKDTLKSVKFDGHPGEKYAIAGFQDGFRRGVYAGTGAVASGLNVVIGQIDNGLLPDLPSVLSSLTKLRDVAVKEAGL